MKKVAILLSTYNGVKYLEEQLESLLAQTYPDITIYARDDGSKDETVEILKRYESEGKLTFFAGENLGFVKSFLWLLAHCGEADYYAFCDQDDVWKKDKIKMAVQRLEREDVSKPLLYCSSFDICDGELHKTGKTMKLFTPFTIQKTIVNGQTGFGVTQVMNQKLRKKILSHSVPTLGRVFGHDTYVHLAALCFGKIIYDERTTLSYRRHGANTSTQDYRGGSVMTHQLWRIKEFLMQSNGKKVYLDVQEFYERFGGELDERTRKIFKRYLKKSYSLSNVLQKVCYRGRYRESLVDEIALRLLFLVNKM